MTKKQDSARPELNENNLLRKLKDHIVQLEALVIFLVIVNAGLFVVGSTEIGLLVWLFPCLFLILLRPIMRVMNPTGEARNSLVWAGTFGGVFGAATGAITDIFSGGLTGGQGTLIGISGGTVVGAAVGNYIENWGKKDRLLERGEAFDYLYKKRRVYSVIANASLIDKVLDEDIPSFDKNTDGRQWYSVDDIKSFLRNGRISNKTINSLIR
jgi:hypothetical protein